MSEGSHGVDAPPQINITSEYVLSHINKYSELNAPTLEEGDKKFRHALVSAVERSGLGDQVGDEGGDLLVHHLADEENIVVKRLRARSFSGDIDAYWGTLREEHEFIEKYFGRRFVPDTEFIVADFSGGPPAPPHKEHAMVQERVKGDDYNIFFHENKILSPKVKGEMTEFIKRYEHMMREGEAVIDPEIRIDEEGEQVKILDTNFPTYFKEVREYPNQLLALLSIDPLSIQTTQDIIAVLTTRVPELASLHGQDYYSIIAALNDEDTTGDNMYNNTIDHLNATYGHSVGYGFDVLVKHIKRFAPPGHHNQLITGMMRDFGITDEDLSDQGGERP